MQKTLVNPDGVYQTPWRFNHAIKVTDARSLVFLSGVVGYDDQGKLPKDILTQAENTYATLKQIVEASGGTLRDVVKTNVYVGEDYQIHRDELRAIRARYFDGEDVPSTTLLRVAGFAQTDYLIEIEAIVALGD